MKRKSICTVPLLALLLLAALPLTAFDWPQDEVMSDTFYSYFGQLRGGIISTSLIFADTSDIKAADNGYVVAVINEYEDDSVFFPSALGNAVILAHGDDLMTVYGNIDKETIPASLYTSEKAETGTVFGSSGNAGWQQGRSSLEFQTIDTASGNAVNPRVLMPRVGKELSLSLSGITLEGKGVRYDLLVQRTLPAGSYRVYRQRQSVAMPYKTRVVVNGIVADEISYDQLIQNGSVVYAAGRKNYPKEALYPDARLQLLGEATLTPGKNTLGIALTDILGEVTATSYSLTIY